MVESRSPNADVFEAARLVTAVKVDNARRLFEWQAAQKQVIDQTENGCVQSDAERESDHGNRSERRRFSKFTVCETDVVHGSGGLSFRFKQSFGAQCLDRVDQRGATRRHKTGNEGNSGQDERNGEHRSQIGGANAKEGTLKQTRRNKHADDAENQTDPDKAHALDDDQPQNIVTLRAEGDANSDLVRPLRDGVTHHPKNSCGGEKKRDQREKTDEHRVQTRLGDRLRHIIRQCSRPINRQVLVDLGDGAAQRSRERLRIDRRSNKDRHRMDSELLMRNVNLRPWRNFQTDQMHVGHYADDFAHRRFARIDRAIWSDPLADRILTGKITLSETFGNNRDGRGIFVVALGKSPAERDRSAQGPEIFGSNDVNLRDRLLAFRQRPLLNVETDIDVAPAQRNPPGRGSRLHTGKNRNALKQFLVKVRRVLRFRITRIRQLETRRDHFCVIESGWNFLQTEKTFDEQSRAGEKNKREHNLDDNEARARPTSGHGFTGPASSLIH